MSALPQAIPLALAAALNPPAILALILLLTAEHPQRLVLGFLAGAAAAAVGVGFGVLSTHSWTLVAVLAGAAGVWLLLRAISDLS